MAGLRHSGQLRPSLIFAATTVAAGVVVSFLPLAAGASANTAAIGLLAQALTATASRWWAGWRGDRHGHAGLLIPGLALAAAGMITLWLGLVANIGQIVNGDAGGSAARVPDRPAVVRVDAGESLQDVAHRVAPDAPARQVAERIRELNDLNSPSLVAGQTLIAPVG